MTSALFFAIISPFLWGFVNIFDKYIIVKKVRNPISFTTIASIISFIISLILIFLLDWSEISYKAMLVPIFTGILYGFQVLLYYYFLKKEDVSTLVGFVYTYPLFVAILSFFFLNEILSITSYIGMILILTGVLMLSVRLKRIKLKVAVWVIISIILITSIYEFCIKITTLNMPEINGLSIQLLTSNFVVFTTLFNKKIRKDFYKELKNFRFAVLIEILTIFATLTIYLAMSGLSATIVTSISAIQPLAVLFYERIADKIFGKMQRDHLLLPKLSAISLMVLGIILLYISEIT